MCLSCHQVGRYDTRCVCCVTRWQKLQKSLAEHKQKLAAALEVHAFNRDIDDINDRINEKVPFFTLNSAIYYRKI